MGRKQAITSEQRAALRAWYQRQYSKPSQKACIEWFFDKYSYRISQSTVSESLSKQYTSLDTDDSQSAKPRSRTGQWPELEKILYEWQKRVEEKGLFTSGELIIARARQIWHQLPESLNEPVPSFSVGWLSKFKKQHSLKVRIQYGEAGSIDEEAAEQKMAEVRMVTVEYSKEDIYNMDETGLFWRMVPSRGLSTVSQPGVKKSKTRVTITHCVNASGSDQMKPWIIGTAKQPRSLRNISVSAMGGEWRWNKKAWMNTTIMKQWLQAFYQHIGTERKVVLLMDNFSAHSSAVEEMPPPSNIRIL